MRLLFVLFQQPQMEQGLYPSSPIPTTGTAVTRLADDVDGTAYLNAIINSVTTSPYAVWWDGRSVYVEGDFANQWYFSDGTNNTYSTARIQPTGEQRQVVFDGGVGQVNRASGVSPAPDESLSLFNRCEEDNFAFSLNGGTALTDTAGTSPTVNNALFGRRVGGTSRMHQQCDKRFAVYSSGLGDSDLEAGL